MNVILLADAGPLITLAYADALDTLFAPKWRVVLVDMVVHEVTRNKTPTSDKIKTWIEKHNIFIQESNIFKRYKASLETGSTPRKSNLGELATQEVMHSFVLNEPPEIGVFLFEDHKIARESFVIPDNCRKISTRAYLAFLEQNGFIESAKAIERKAIVAGRAFSQILYP